MNQRKYDLVMTGLAFLKANLTAEVMEFGAFKGMDVKAAEELLTETERELTIEPGDFVEKFVVQQHPALHGLNIFRAADQELVSQVLHKSTATPWEMAALKEKIGAALEPAFYRTRDGYLFFREVDGSYSDMDQRFDSFAALLKVDTE